MDNNELKHVGVLGMKWGHRSATSQPVRSGSGVARKNTETALKDARRIYKNKGSGKNPKNMTDKEIDAELTTITSAKQSKKIQARIDKENARIEKRASEAMSKKMAARETWNRMGTGEKAVAVAVAGLGAYTLASLAAGTTYSIGSAILGKRI